MTYWNFRNRNRRKWKALRRRTANIRRWLVGTIEGKLVRHASLCRVRQIESQTTERQTSSAFITPNTQVSADDKKKETKKFQKKEQRIDRSHKRDEFPYINNDKIIKNGQQKQMAQLNDAKNGWDQKNNSAVQTLGTRQESENRKEKSKRKSQISENKREKIDNALLSNAEIASNSVGQNVSMGELSIDVTTNSGKPHSNEMTTPLTKCSVDSGVNSSSASFSPAAFDLNLDEFVEKVQNSFQNALSVRGSEKYKFNAIKPIEPRKHVVRRRAGLGLLQQDVEYCLYMMETYGDNYEEMIKDKRNIYMDDETAIARKIRIFRESVHYREYVASRSATPQPAQQPNPAASVS